MKCGFVGLGSLGAPIVRRIIGAGYPVAIWDARHESLVAFSGTSAQIAPNISAVGATADHVGICVVDDLQVREVCAQLFPIMRSGARISVHSTVHPNTCIALAEQASERGISFIDAPVSGGSPAADEGKLTVMVGAGQRALAAALPIFETFGSPIIYVGGVGAGQTAKLINNALMATNFALAHHAINAGVALGLNRTELIEIIKASSGRSFGLEVYARNSEAFDFASRHILTKDLRLLDEMVKGHPAGKALRDAAGSFFQLHSQP